MVGLPIILGGICLRACNPIDPSFQILHAIHSMERLLDEMIRRSAVFDVVFWEGELQGIVRRLVTDFVSSVSRYSLPHAEGRYGFRGIVTFACPGPFIQPPRRALLKNGARNICLLGLNRPSLACLPATHKGSFIGSYPLFGSSDGTCSQCLSC